MEEEHVILRDSTRRFFAAHLSPNAQRWRRQGTVDRSFWHEAGKAGLLGASVPAAYGGSGGTRAHDAVILQEHARTGETGWGFAVHRICADYILAYGSQEQKRRWLPGLVSGELVPAVAMTEPGTGSDLQNVRTLAQRSGDDYLISGAKTFISNGQSADIVITVAKTQPELGAKGISLLVVETKDAAGFVRGRNLEKLGMHGQDTCELFFDGVRVPRANLLGLEEGRGFRQLVEQLPWERLMLALAAVAFLDTVLDQTLAYVKGRKAFGQRVMDFQNTRFKLAECKTKLEVTRAFADECMVRLLAGTLDAATAAMAKWWAAQTQCEIVDECLQLHGGNGYMLEYPIARYYSDVRVTQIFGGTREIMKEIIARSLDVDA